MRVEHDELRFDELQLRFKNRLGRAILAALDEEQLDQDLANRLCDAVLFHVASAIDGAEEPLTYEGRDAVPRLLFLNTDAADTLITSESGESWMHEYAMGTSENLRKGTAV